MWIQASLNSMINYHRDELNTEYIFHLVEEEKSINSMEFPLFLT